LKISKFKSTFSNTPLIAILRGIKPKEVLKVAEVLQKSGFRVLEIPLNSPSPLQSIENIKKEFGSELIIGAGTVLTTTDVQDVQNAGGQIIVSPHTEKNIIKSSKMLGLISIPGVATPSEAFFALKCGAHMLKLFPAETLPPSTLKAWRAILPKDTWVLPVGGITPKNMHPYLSVGANGFGLGSFLFKPNYSIKTIFQNAQQFIRTYQFLDKKN
jgi:2-dehydro-3-deoxyphosphogalactonate aldolase